MPTPLVAQRLPIAGSGSVQLAYASNFPLDAPRASVRRAIISVHGTGAPAHKYFTRAMSAVRGVEPGDMLVGTATPNALRDPCDVLVVAPQFITAHDYSGPGPLPNDVLRWSSPFWGQDAENGGHPSSFHALDEIIKTLCDTQRFPNLRRIVLVGHSGGGQILNRYAAAGRGEDLYAAPRGVRVRYIPMNPGSYQYFSGMRPAGSSETSFGVPVAVGCPHFDVWGYGLSGPLSGYHAAHGLGVAQLEQQYKRRDVIYLVGSDDNDPNDSSMPSGCAAAMQGAHRLTKSRAYFNHLVQHFGRSILRHQQHAVIPDAGHSGGQMLRSPITRRFMMEPYRTYPRLARRGDAGEAGTAPRMAAIRHWDDRNGNTESQIVTAVGTGNGRMKLIGWRQFDDGSLLRTSSSATTAHGARGLGLVRVQREQTTGSNTGRRMTCVTSYVTTGSHMRLAAWDTDEQGSFQSPVTASSNRTGRARLVRIVRLRRARFATAQRDMNDRLRIKLWSVGNNASIQRQAATSTLGGSVDEVQIVRRSQRRFLVLATTTTGLRIVHVSASNESTTPATLTVDSDTFYPSLRGDELCATMTPQCALVVGLRDHANSRLRVATFRVVSSGPSELHNSTRDTGRIHSGTSVMALGRYGVCFAVRTRADKGKLLFYRLSPGGKSRRVADSGAAIAEIKRHHALVDHGSVVGDDIVFACANDNGDLRLMGFRYTS